MQTAGETEEPLLLDRLTRLEAAVERQYTDNHYRFSAANAYYDLVQQRIEELREERIEGFQTFREFNDRRFLPAIATCRAVSARQSALSERIAHATVLALNAGQRDARKAEPGHPAIHGPARQSATAPCSRPWKACRSRPSPITSWVWSTTPPRAFCQKRSAVSPELVAAWPFRLRLLAVGFGLAQVPQIPGRLIHASCVQPNCSL